MLKYVLVLVNHTFSIKMFEDLWRRNDVTLYVVNRDLPIPLSCIRRFYVDPRFCKKRIPGRDIWEKDLLDYADDEVCYIFTSEALTYLSEYLLLEIKNHITRPKMVLLLIDSLHGNSVHLQWVRSLIEKFSWDLVITYDKYDAKEFGFNYMGCNIYSYNNEYKTSNNISDIYYVGSEKAGRNVFVSNLYEYLHERKVVCNFHLMDRKYYAYKYIGKSKRGLKYHLLHGLSYDYVMKDILATNCILEVVQKGQKAQTARYYEAVCMNKKLLTNNHYIKQLPFYNEQTMKVFDDYCDIDIEWLKRRENIDYGYCGEFSPVRILDIIKMNIKNK